MKLNIAVLIMGISFFTAQAQSTSKIYHNLQKFNSHKRVLYVAAHPDDENTRAIAWMANGELAKTAYLSLTRGDGGQNLIGTEMGPLLGVLRTQELLAARRIDGGQQYFSRAVDFGYSKTADETFEKWDKEKILHDAVYVIRNFKPDVIVTRFPPDSRAGHGHHTASAMIALEAFEAAADPNQFKDIPFDAWQAKSVYWNSSVWWFKNLDSLARNNDDYILEDIGGFNSVMGVSYNELGSKARSQHRCQGFGVEIDRGSQTEYFKWMSGEKLQNGLLGDANRTWQDLGLDANFSALAKKVEADFSFTHPENSLTDLFSLLKQMEAAPSNPLLTEKTDQLKQIIVECMGLFAEANATDYSFLAGEEVKVNSEFLLRNKIDVDVTFPDLAQNRARLPQNAYLSRKGTIFKSDKTYNAYWLDKPFTTTFDLKDLNDLTHPENEPLFEMDVRLFYGSDSLDYKVPVQYKWSDRVDGEQIRPVVTTPDASVQILNKSLVFTQGETKVIDVLIKRFSNNLSTELTLELPKGWETENATVSLENASKYSEQIVSFSITAPKKASEGFMSFTLGDVAAQTIHEVDYEHIPAQLIFLPTSSKIIALDIDFEPGKVAYIEGAGDEVAEAIAQLGYTVDVLSKEDLASVDLLQYKAVFAGIRAYNTNPWLFDFHDKFNAYVKAGGNYIVQYNTQSRSKSFDAAKIGPYPFTLGRNRVSEEGAKVSFVDPTNPLLNTPNKITKKDFDDWVQERGLYFAEDLDPNFQAVFSWHDKDESPQLGGLIIANYGEGSFVYTGISFFRQLPAGVPGAYKLLANLISYEQE